MTDPRPQPDSAQARGSATLAGQERAMSRRDRRESDREPVSEDLEGAARAEEKTAAEMAARAAELTRAGRLTEAKALRSAGRHLRVRSLEHRARAWARRTSPE
jgi:hypothetical protein